MSTRAVVRGRRRARRYQWGTRLSIAYTRSPGWFAIVVAGVVLAAVAALEARLGYPPGLRLLSLLPVWLATRLGGFRIGILLAGLATLWRIHADYRVLHVIQAEDVWFNAFLYLTLYAGIVAFVAQIERTLQRVNRLAKHDPLTGLLNRRALFEFGFHAIEKAGRLDRPLTLVLFDCDRFKEINDHFGHRTGDELLKLAGRVLERDARATDVVARWGGDEFVALLVGADRLQAKTYVERVHQAFERESHLLGFPTTFSSGIAELGLDGGTVTELLETADRAMYRRKAAKRSLPADLIAGHS